MKSWLPWTIAALLAAILLHHWYSGPPTVAEAAAKNMVAVAVGGFDESSDSVRVTLSRASASGKLVAILPAGTIIGNGDEGGQRLMTARSVTLVIAAGAPSATAMVEVYCLDQFSLRPTPASPLSLAAGNAGGDGDGGSATEETEPVRKLALCLEESSATLRTRQLAIWLVGGGYLDQDYEAVRQRLVESYQSTIAAEAEARRGEFDEGIRRSLANLPRATVDAKLAQFHAGRAADMIADQAHADAEKALDGFRQSLSAVEPCVSGFKSKKFVVSAPTA